MGLWLSLIGPELVEVSVFPIPTLLRIVALESRIDVRVALLIQATVFGMLLDLLVEQVFAFEVQSLAGS